MQLLRCNAFRTDESGSGRVGWRPHKLYLGPRELKREGKAELGGLRTKKMYTKNVRPMLRSGYLFFSFASVYVFRFTQVINAIYLALTD